VPVVPVLRSTESIEPFTLRAEGVFLMVFVGRDPGEPDSGYLDAFARVLARGHSAATRLFLQKFTNLLLPDKFIEPREQYKIIAISD
jgi:hypothetical protein